MPNLTTNYDLYKPLVNDPTDQDLWGDYLNDNFDEIDDLIFALHDNPTVYIKTASYTVLSTDSLSTVLANASTLTVTLPEVSGLDDYFAITMVAVEDELIIQPNGTDTINGGVAGASYTIPQYCAIKLFSDGTSDWFIKESTSTQYVEEAIAASATVNREVFTASGTFTAEVTGDHYISGVAGGGGGGSSTSSNSASGSGGAGGGAGENTLNEIVALTEGDTVTVTIGSGGSAGSSGTTTSFGSHISLSGGSGGGSGSSGSLGGLGGSGDPDGQGGCFAFAGGIGGSGGSSPFGGGGGGARCASNGSTGCYGGGGGGAAGGTGGTGGDGILIVEW